MDRQSRSADPISRVCGFLVELPQSQTSTLPYDYLRDMPTTRVCASRAFHYLSN